MRRKAQFGKIELQIARSIKTQEVKDKTIAAANDLLKNYGYVHVTVRNICTMAGISTGTFYHHFKNKEGLFIYFTRDGFAKYLKKNAQAIESMGTFEKLMDLYCWYVCYFADMGIDFMANYFSTNNLALRARREINDKYKTQQYESIAKYTLQYIKDAQKEGIVSSEISAEDLYHELDTIMYGVVFSWCLRDGGFDLREYTKRMLEMHWNCYTVH